VNMKIWKMLSHDILIDAGSSKTKREPRSEEDGTVAEVRQTSLRVV
jgi:hypothetical protein